MKNGRSITDLAAEIERQANSKRDLVAPAKRIVMTDGDLLVVGNHGFGINEIAHDQLATFTNIPRPYYDRMRTEAPALLAGNVNTWLHRSEDKRLVRTLDGNVRALLSDKYRPLEHFDLAQAVLPVLADQQLEIISCEITERRLYLKAVDQRINADIPRGGRMGDGSHTIFDTCVPAIIISNSEVGFGQLSVETGVWTRACTNLAVFATDGMKKRHVGARHELTNDTIAELLSDETKMATDRAIWLQVRDVVKGAFDEARFAARIERIKGTVENKIEADPIKVVDFTAKRFGFTEAEKGNVLRHLIEGAALSQYGLSNAITRAAEDVGSYDRAYELERAGGNVIDLHPSEWQRVANAIGDPLKAAA
jgi:hypothetical protein